MVIRTALAAKATGAGCRRIAVAVGRPVETVRDWLPLRRPGGGGAVGVHRVAAGGGSGSGCPSRRAPVSGCGHRDHHCGQGRSRSGFGLGTVAPWGIRGSGIRRAVAGSGLATEWISTSSP